MHQVQRAYYEIKFLAEFLRKPGNEFQDFFSEIMEKGYPGDFQRVRPWGNVGDRKNDGYLKSKRCLYQVYAPNSLELSKTLAKIREDFHGALPYWRKHFDTWTFVHNSYHGLAADVLKALLDLELANKPIQVHHCGFEELRLEVFRLDEVTLKSLLGPAPTARDMLQIGLEDLQPVLLNIARHPPKIDDVRPVPPGKIEANGLSEHAKAMLMLGMQGRDLVAKFFANWHDVTFGEQIAETFTRAYKSYQAESKDGDEIYTKLFTFAGGQEIREPSHICSVAAVLTYLFEGCHIFEEPRADRL